MTLTIAETTYDLSPVTVGDIETLQLADKTGLQFNVGLLAASLRKSEDDVKALPFYAVFVPLLEAAKNVNGLVSPKAEPVAEPAATESISNTSSAA